MSVHACVSVCPVSALTSQNPHVQASRNFLCVLPVAVARSCSDDNDIMLCTSGFVGDVMFAHNGLWAVWRVAKKAYSQSGSPEGSTDFSVVV